MTVDDLPIDDDGRLADLVSGAMWIATALIGLAVLALPGSETGHVGLAAGLAGFAVAWGSFSLWLGATRKTMRIESRAVVTAAMMPVVALALWATGGASSFLQPVLFFTAIFIAWFFPPRLAWALATLFIATFATPLLYDGDAVDEGFPGRATVFLVAIVGVTIAMQFLKRRLVKAEAHQRSMAERDPLTDLRNRRGFDRALEQATARCEAHRAGRRHDDAAAAVALVLFDFDDFKIVNDDHGHPVGDAVLRSVADACQAVVREGDCLARIGGDEFAVVAPGAGREGVGRLVSALNDALRNAELPHGLKPMDASFAWAVAPQDTTDPNELVQRADQRLLARKRQSKLRVGDP
jgi:diguanylate cyclase (GGDEF)-like protein